MDPRRARAIRIDGAIGLSIAYALSIVRAYVLGGTGPDLLVVAVGGAMLLAAIYAMVLCYAAMLATR